MDDKAELMSPAFGDGLDRYAILESIFTVEDTTITAARELGDLGEVYPLTKELAAMPLG